jgi:hypothetical protein
MNHHLVEEELAAPVQSLGRAALHLHMNRSVDLEMPAPADWPESAGPPEHAAESTSVIRFDSLEHRNTALSELFYEKLKQHGQVGAADLFGVVRTLWIREISRSDTAAGRLLARVESDQDVFSLAEEHIRNSGDVFDVVQMLGTMLQHVDRLTFQTMIKLAQAQYDRTKNDSMRGLFFEQLANWMAPRAAHARELLQVVLAADDLATEGLLSVAIGAIFRDSPEEGFALAIAELDSPRATRRRSGRWMLGQFLLREPPAGIRAAIEGKIADGLRSHDAEALADWIRVAGVVLHASTAFDEPMLLLCESENDAALAAVARALFLKGDEFAARHRVSMWLPSLLTYSAEEARTALDFALMQLLEKGIEVQPSVPEFLTAWATRHSGPSAIETKFVHSFGQTVRKLQSKPGMFESLMTHWLIAPDGRLAAAAAGVLRDFEAEGFNTMRLDERLLSTLSKSKLVFLARRLLGNVHSTPQVLSMSLSMLQVKDEQLEHVLSLMGSLIVEELGYDYPRAVVGALDAVSKTETRQTVLKAIEHWRRAIRMREEAIERLPRRNELWPPSQLQRQFALARARQMQKAKEQASEKSVFSQMVTTIPLKAGRGFFNHLGGKFGESTPLQTLSYSIELPRREVLDPVGNAFRGIQLRMASEGSE